jgi:OpgC protein
VSKSAASRLDTIDMLRGITIIEMLAAHFARYFPKPVELAITYTETAMALFVLLAGFMVGWRIVNFSTRPLTISRDLLWRAAKIFAVQVVLVLTAGVVVYVASLYGAADGKTFTQFIGQSLLLYNQIGLLHILPTFLPLFVIAPAILAAIAAGLELPLLLASGALFAIGHINPYVLNYGAPAIFPFVMFQLYFVVGCIVGARTHTKGMVDSRTAGYCLMAAIAALCASMAWVHLKFLPPGTLSTHPLNAYGLVYHLPLIAVVTFAVIRFASMWRGLPGTDLLLRFGRNSMLAFVLHVYCAIALQVANRWIALPMAVNIVAIAASIFVMNRVLERYEWQRSEAYPPAWVRALSALFR